jgi:membrane-bound serine protease (ClpP class)
MSAVVIAVLLQLLGVIVILAEFIVPSAGILAIAALAVLGYSIFYAFTEVSAFAGIVTIGADIVALPLAVLLGGKILSRSPLALHSALKSTEGAQVQREDLNGYVGKSGTTVSILRPAGIALIEGRRIDVMAHGDFIDRDTAVTVVAVEGNQVIVARSAQPILSTPTKGGIA